MMRELAHVLCWTSKILIELNTSCVTRFEMYLQDPPAAGASESRGAEGREAVLYHSDTSRYDTTLGRSPKPRPRLRERSDRTYHGPLLDVSVVPS